jgi:hypothetical protein
VTRGAVVTYFILTVVTLGIWLDPLIWWLRRG